MDKRRKADIARQKAKVEIANSVTIPEYCQAIGFELIFKGGHYKHPGWNGLTIKGNGEAYKNFSNEGSSNPELEQGGSIKFVQWIQEVWKNERYNWNQAVDALVSIAGYSVDDNFDSYKITQRNQPKDHQVKSKPLILPERADRMNHVFAYLEKTRKIDHSIVKEIVDRKLLFETRTKREGQNEGYYYYCTFICRDFEGNDKAAFLRPTYHNTKFKMNRGDDMHFGFAIPGNNHRIRIFESPIDLMSKLSILKMCDEQLYQKSREDTWLSMNGLKHEKVFYYLERHPEINTVVLSVDNDESGRKFCNDFKKEVYEKYADTYSLKLDIPKVKKDWNEQLCDIQERIMNRKNLVNTISINYKDKNQMTLK